MLARHVRLNKKKITPKETISKGAENHQGMIVFSGQDVSPATILKKRLSFELDSL